MWDGMTGACMATIEDDYKPWGDSLPIAFSHDSKIFVSAWLSETKCVINLWDTKSYTRIARHEVYGSPGTKLKLSHDSKILASRSYESTIRLYDTMTGTCISTLEERIGAITAFAFSHDSKTLVSVSEDGYIWLWDIATGVYTATLKGFSGFQTLIAFSHDSRMLVSASKADDVQLLDTAKGTTIATFKTRASRAVGAVAFSHDSKLLALETGNAIEILDVAIESGQTEVNMNKESFRALNFVNDTKVLGSSRLCDTITLWDVSTGVCTATIKGGSNWVSSIALSHDSKLLALESASRNGKIQLWDITTGTCIATFEGHGDSVSSATPKSDLMPSGIISAVTFSHNSQLLASASPGGIIKLWNIDTNACIAVLESHSTKIDWLGFSHHPNILVSSGDTEIKVWDIIKGICTTTLEGYIPDYYVDPIALSYGSDMLASVWMDETIQIYDISTGVCIKTLPASNPVTYVKAMAFSHGSTLLASVSWQRAAFSAQLRLWDIATGHCAATIDVCHLAQACLAFDPMGPFLNTGAGSFTLVCTPPSRITTAALLEAAPVDLEADQPPRPGNPVAMDVRLHRRGIGLSEDSQWVMWDNDRIIWLPRSYRLKASAVRGSTLVIESPRRQAIFLTISPPSSGFWHIP